MKSMILKDIYNISHNAKSMVMTMIIMACTLFSNGVEGYMAMSVIMFSMLIATTFAFDDASKWNNYALIMPVSKKQIVAAKYVMILIFSTIGVLWGLTVGSVAGLLIESVTFSSANLFEFVAYSFVCIWLGMVYGGLCVPLFFKFGAEKARMLVIFSALVIAGLAGLVYMLADKLSVYLGDSVTLVLAVLGIAVILLILFLSYRISCIIFEKKDI